jgi:signal transduction histidine kinase/ActR/RegA family two-component response regulator
MESTISLDERARHVRAASNIGLVVGTLFSIYNLFTPGMLVLGLAELAAVLFLVVPAAVLGRTSHRVAASELLLYLSAVVIFGALVVVGGVEGTGLLWVYTLPFLAFFLKGQRLGWYYSLFFLGLVAVYLIGVSPKLVGAYHYSQVVGLHFLLSLSFYTLVAAAFNHVRSRFEAQLQQGKEQAEAAYQAKSRFLASASHDLRQPAHALGMFVARLAQLPHDPQTRELVNGVDASVRVLQDMLDNFFDYSRLDAPSMQVRRRAFPVEELLEPLRNVFSGMVAQKGLRLRIPKSRFFLKSDPVLLHRVLLNLVSNAVQHTQQGSVMVTCRPLHGGTHARIDVCDSGIGIASEYHFRIFEEFFQVGNHERDRTKGLGLGLSIVERSCRLLNLPLTLRSGLGCGTRFQLVVPMAPIPRAGAPKAVATTVVTSELPRLNVLLIEDDALGSAAVRGLLESWGCQVTVAYQAQAACDVMRQMPHIDFVLSDYRLPGEHNGIDAVRMVRQVAGQHIAACVISGDTDGNVLQQTQAAGLVLLQKPVRPAKLRSVLRRLTQVKGSEADSPAS